MDARVLLAGLRACSSTLKTVNFRELSLKGGSWRDLIERVAEAPLLDQVELSARRSGVDDNRELWPNST